MNFFKTIGYLVISSILLYGCKNNNCFSSKDYCVVSYLYQKKPFIFLKLDKQHKEDTLKAPSGTRGFYIEVKEHNENLYLAFQKAKVNTKCIESNMITPLLVDYELQFYKLVKNGDHINLFLVDRSNLPKSLEHWSRSVKIEKNVSLVCDGSDIGYDEGSIIIK